MQYITWFYSYTHAKLIVLLALNIMKKGIAFSIPLAVGRFHYADDICLGNIT